MTLCVVYCAPSAVELAGKALSLGGDIRVIALCEGEGRDFPSVAGLASVFWIPAQEDDCAQGTCIAEALRALAPDAVLFPATVRGRFLAAWVAGKLQTGLTADCTELALTPEGHLLQTRPAMGGSLIAEILCRQHRPQMASVRPGVFPPPLQATVCPSVPVFPAPTTNPPAPLSLLTQIGFVPTEAGLSLQNATVIVTGGKGVGTREGFAVLAELAALLGGALGASRGAVDAGFATYAQQIGQTGVTVRPALCLAFGVSGSVQHLVGINGAHTIVAVNRDRHAPIFRHADYGIVGDWHAAAQAMIRHLKERKDQP